MTDPFGKLSYENHTFETRAECLVVALQAAMKVHGIKEDDKSMKCLRRLKKAMKKSKVRKYSFSIISKEGCESDDTSPSPVHPVEENEHSAALIKYLSSFLGAKCGFKCLSSTSSRYLVLKVRCVALEGVFPKEIKFPPLAPVLRKKGINFVSFSVVKRVPFPDKGAEGLIVQCIYGT